MGWTEEENSKWNSEGRTTTQVSEVLTALRTAAQSGNSKQITASLKETISNCKKMEKELEEESRKLKEIENNKEKLQNEQKTGLDKTEPNPSEEQKNVLVRAVQE